MSNPDVRCLLLTFSSPSSLVSPWRRTDMSAHAATASREGGEVSALPQTAQHVYSASGIIEASLGKNQIPA